LGKKVAKIVMSPNTAPPRMPFAVLGDLFVLSREIPMAAIQASGKTVPNGTPSVSQQAQ
jgi:hypothetical protein